MNKRNLFRTGWVIVGITAFLLRLYGFHQAPEGLSLNEIRFLEATPFVFHQWAYYFRLLPLLASTASTLVFSGAVYRKTGKAIPALAAGAVFALEPWSFLYARYINYTAFFILYMSIAFYFSRGPIRNLALFLIPLLVFFPGTGFTSFFDSGKAAQILQLFDAKTLFFDGDNASSYLRIPLTGYFLLVDIPAFALGCYVFFTNTLWRKTCGVFWSMGLGAIGYFLLNPQLVPAERLGPLLACLTLITASGYSSMIEAFMKRKILLLALAFLVLSNVFFYQELFRNHFDRRNSTEWGYAEKTLIAYLRRHPETKTVYVTSKKDYLASYIRFFLPDTEIKDLRENRIPIDCAPRYNNTCILKQEELPLVGLDKDKAKNAFTNRGGLPEFFLL